jgi:hypothetical protein
LELTVDDSKPTDLETIESLTPSNEFAGLEFTALDIVTAAGLAPKEKAGAAAVVAIGTGVKEV